MGKCSQCGADTELYERGVLVCIACCERIEEARKQTARELFARRESQPEKSVGAC